MKPMWIATPVAHKTETPPKRGTVLNRIVAPASLLLEGPSLAPSDRGAAAAAGLPLPGHSAGLLDPEMLAKR
jgi:hypothetical protein